MANPERFWDRFARNYDKKTDAQRQSLLDTIEVIKGHLRSDDRVLDFACATGEKALGVAPVVASVHGIDVSGKMIERASAKAIERGVENARFTKTDLFDPSLEPGSCDAIIAFYVLHLLDDPGGTLERLGELLAPGGRLICETPCMGRSSAMGCLMTLLSVLPMVPKVQRFGVSELEALVRDRAGLRVEVAEVQEGGVDGLLIVAVREPGA